ncbi:hypothetical protein O181_028965 [Austropuccinia psidii MF-1]|uniref:Uncharacterized protein n=1 Tax=Austropuccinia psidii MF-1 TaxID=1389203 RepID=A0A9Q3H4R4_9BASI|nr:hypothetical protein [Austropuccinia psidii MF-1]
MLEKGWNPRLPADKLRKGLIEIHTTASRFKIMLDKVKHHSKQSMNDAFESAKQKWDKSHKVPDFEVGDLVLVSESKERGNSPLSEYISPITVGKEITKLFLLKVVAENKP